MPFQIAALPAAPFAPLFALPEHALPASARRTTAVGNGEPCRVSLTDAVSGETLLLVNHAHQPADTPYRASHAIYVRETAEQARPCRDAIPEMLGRRLLSVRAFDEAGAMRTADVTDGRALAPLIETMLADPGTAYLHLHAARHGCYLARVDRA